MSQPPTPPFSGQPYPEQQPYPAQQPYPGQPYPAQPFPGQPMSGQPFPSQPMSGQPYSGQPYPGQGYPGQPNPDVPTSVPPQPGFPSSAPPFGGQPGFAGLEFAQPGYPAPQPPKKSRALPIVLVSLAVILVLCVGGGTAVFLAARNNADKLTSSRTSSTGVPAGEPTTDTGAEPTDEPTKAPQATVSVTEPKRLGGRPKLTDAQFAGVTKELKQGLADVPGATGTVGALYGTPEKRDIVVVVAAEAPVEDPQKELDGTFLGAGIGGLKVSGITTVDAGPLGGAAKCGKAEASGISMAMCGWADDGSVGWIIWYFKSVSKAKAEFPALRGEIEKKSN
ncbi:hypothetical protein [Krasilnikovia sp. MM14-A1259]|uniref:hypothetical protein n=1 Tax=Krasilnikovia sp. MM14-A1259 TaxID=3373539 RepID=UPI0038116574